MRYRSNNILALVPPTKEGENILNQALFFRQWLGMRLFVYHIIDKPALFKKLIRPKQTQLQKNDALNSLKNFVKNIAPPEDLEHLTYRIKAGSQLPVLLKQSKNGGYEFLMIDKSKNEKGMDTDEFDKLISRSNSPVMALNNGHQMSEIKKIVIPVDISQSTQKKLLWATYFAKKFSAKITIVSALGINIETKHSLAWRNAEKLKHMLTQRGIECDVEILKSTGHEKQNMILEYIEKEKPGMVIIRTHQDSKLSGLQIGKFVSEIIHGCSMPVFAVTQFMHPMPVDFEL
ncbi:universal stress protein [Mariniphaga sp.]|uniref:universal stress protein n=1 Tax=Mariniphaga sp. TaxID=1954475 RepID=UPI0035629CD3